MTTLTVTLPSQSTPVGHLGVPANVSPYTLGCATAAVIATATNRDRAKRFLGPLGVADKERPRGLRAVDFIQ